MNENNEEHQSTAQISVAMRDDSTAVLSCGEKGTENSMESTEGINSLQTSDGLNEIVIDVEANTEAGK